MLGCFPWGVRSDDHSLAAYRRGFFCQRPDGGIREAKIGLNELTWGKHRPFVYYHTETGHLEQTVNNSTTGQVRDAPDGRRRTGAIRSKVFVENLA
jgi:hypothetical protein